MKHKIKRYRVDYKDPRTDKERKECIEADYFARALLMPEMSFRHWWNKVVYISMSRELASLYDPFQEMATIFGVEREQIVKRRADLKDKIEYERSLL